MKKYYNRYDNSMASVNSCHHDGLCVYRTGDEQILVRSVGLTPKPSQIVAGADLKLCFLLYFMARSADKILSLREEV